ncbi:MAG: hypothetical protein SFU25_05250 [Candidatus Caenarcaniphilales bacterium]|nr:hypothetical protein [Candidatus Caenarcaniphilales bacterium]
MISHIVTTRLNQSFHLCLRPQGVKYYSIVLAPEATSLVRNRQTLPFLEEDPTHEIFHVAGNTFFEAYRTHNYITGKKHDSSWNILPLVSNIGEFPAFWFEILYLEEALGESLISLCDDFVLENLSALFTFNISRFNDLESLTNMRLGLTQELTKLRAEVRCLVREYFPDIDGFITYWRKNRPQSIDFTLRVSDLLDLNSRRAFFQQPAISQYFELLENFLTSQGEIYERF